ncbi:MAG TPA: cytochrome C oxidase subunit IV family protein [Parachlamydiaceae bacterium]|nr:cytochrome C oxidase subunit IV family protein [Parachlamydiaceae bacterium]
MAKEITLRLTGFILSLLLTLAAYFVIVSPETFSFNLSTAAMVIFALALVQSIVQLVFFIDVWKEDGPRWNLIFFISTASIIFIIIFFSIWIINHLNYNMH